MNSNEFMAEILKSNPNAKFLESEDCTITTCTPTQMRILCFGIPQRYELHTIIGHEKSSGSAITLNGSRYSKIFAKKKILMTPAQCAEKWLVGTETGFRWKVVGISDNYIITVEKRGTVIDLWRHGFMIADTATSEPYSLEIDE